MVYTTQPYDGSPGIPLGAQKKSTTLPGHALGFLTLPELPGRDQERSHSSSQVDR